MAKNKTQNVTGYYRYTDIMFEWWKVVPADSVEQLKAFMYPACLTAPENPLVNGGPGLELALGTLKSNGECRMMFTSKQIEYIRYWLYEMGLTPQRIPLPSSEFLVTEDKMRSITASIYKDDVALKKGQKDLTKANKRLKGVDPDIQDMRDTFERVRKLYQEGGKTKATWCAVDLESWEYEHTYITEFGYSLVQWEKGEEKKDKGHWVVTGAPRNGKYVADNRDGYLFGETKQFAKKVFAQKIKEFIAGLVARGPLFLVFHDPKGDIDDLKYLGASLDNLSYIVPEHAPESGIFCVDTRRVFSALEGHKVPKALSKICRILGFRDAEKFHNAGNDAEYTMMCLLSMASGAPIDVQREQRWPTTAQDIKPNVKREYAREAKPEDDSDYEDPYAPW